MMRGAFVSLMIVTLAMTAGAAAQTNDAFARALDAQWDFGKPAVSEQRFRGELAKWPPDSAQAQEARTQIARALGLQRKYGDAHAMLDTVDAKRADMPPHVRVRYLLERGRALNSAGEPQRAVPLFTDALALAEREHDAFYAVDAAHMLGIAAPAPERLAWNLKALALAEAAADTRARDWRASLYHNIGWTYFDDGDASRALGYWQLALTIASIWTGAPITSSSTAVDREADALLTRPSTAPSANTAQTRLSSASTTPALNAQAKKSERPLAA